jgi:type IV secretory pathway VirB10-like protein
MQRLALLLAYACGGYRRTLKNEAAARQAGLPKTVAPATQAGAEFVNAIPLGNAPNAKRTELRPPTMSNAPNSCGEDPRTGAPYRYNPQTGQPCDGLPQERLVVRQAPRPIQPKPSEPQKEPAPEERFAALAYQQAQQAILAPTVASNAWSLTMSSWPFQTGNPVGPPVPDLSQFLSRSAGAIPSTADQARSTSAPADDYETENMQARKEAFLSSADKHQGDDYLRSTRAAPLSRYEIKAGWEIPAVLEQSLNSDLPGELKALVTSNVYDTATGMYLLIPQGSRLIGQYDSRISYGQEGVQVAWSRIVFPDASTIDLNGMVGLDSHGNAGLRDRVDRHYKRLIGFSVLTSMFTAAFAISQQRNQSVLVNPSVGQIRIRRRGPGIEPDRLPNYTPQPQRPAHHQGPCRLPIYRPRQPRHPLRIALRGGRTGIKPGPHGPVNRKTP